MRVEIQVYVNKETGELAKVVKFYKKYNYCGQEIEGFHSFYVNENDKPRRHLSHSLEMEIFFKKYEKLSDL